MAERKEGRNGGGRANERTKGGVGGSWSDAANRK